MAKGIAGSTTQCIAPDCDAMGSKGYGYCNKHYQRLKRWGDPTVVGKGGYKITGIQLFWTRVNKNGPVPSYMPHLGPCWLWTNTPDPDGYGKFTLDGKTQRAHIIAYVDLIGPRPEDLVPDHLCRVRHCVNPAHIEWVSNRENILRGYGPPALNARKTHCIHGHELTPENVYLQGTKRRCKSCSRNRKKERRSRVAAQSLLDGSHPPE